MTNTKIALDTIMRSGLITLEEKNAIDAYGFATRDDPEHGGYELRSAIYIGHFAPSIMWQRFRKKMEV